MLRFEDLVDPTASMTEQLASAADYCRKHPGLTLQLPRGILKLASAKGLALQHDVMNGIYGDNPESAVFRYGFDYGVGLDLTDCRDITIDGEGTVLLLDGWVEGITIRNCMNIAVRGLTLDYVRKPYSAGRVIRSDSPFFDVHFDDRYPVSIDMPTSRIYIYSPKESRLLRSVRADAIKEWIAPQTLRFHYLAGKTGMMPQVGESLVIWHMFHFRPGILIQDACNTILESVTLHAQPGMGIVGHRADQVTIRGLRVVPAAGEILSVNTDAMHFTSCTGMISVRDSQFANHGDDMVNIHNYYHKVIAADGCRCIARTVRETHAADMDTFSAGDSLELVNRHTLCPIARMTVVSSAADPQNWTNTLILDRELPADILDHYLLNASRFAAFEMINCHSSNNISRALIKTRNATIEGCTFLNASMTAIHVAAEAGWMEGGPADHVRICRNRLIHCGGMLRGRFKDTGGICVELQPESALSSGLVQPQAHTDIIIEGNIIENGQTDEPGIEAPGTGIYVEHTDKLIIRDNEISGYTHAIVTQNCTHVQINNNYCQEEPADIRRNTFESGYNH